MAAPVAAAAAPAAAGAFSSILSNPALMSKLGSGASSLMTGGSILGDYLNSRADAKAAAAYQAFLNGIANNMQNQLEARAEKYDTKLQNQFNEAEPQFQQEANTQLPELQNMIKDIAEQNTETQRGNLRQINAVLAQQGVRGGQAAILANRALGQTTRDTQRDINNLVYNEALNRQNSRLNYYGDKALTPWKTMSQAYGNSMVGANNALSNAQGNVYQNAYNNMMSNFGRTQKKSKF